MSWPRAHPVDELTRRKGRFARMAEAVTNGVGSPWAVVAVAVALLAWLAVGYLVGFTRAWELILTVGLPVVAVLLLIALQHAQTHDSRAVQLKLDELIRAVEGTRDDMAGIEEGSEEDLQLLGERFRQGPA